MLRAYAKKLIAFPVNRLLSRRTHHPPFDGGFRRIYCHHIRKTGGTSLHRAFLSLGGEPGEDVHERLLESLTYHAISGGYTFVGHNRHLLEAGHYFYGFSHHPAHTLSLPRDTFTITILRDPIERVISHYKMLRYLAIHTPDHSCLKREGSWLGKSFKDFLSNIPKQHLLRQLYMFSKSLDVEQAARRINDCACIFRTEAFEEGVETLAQTLDLELPLVHARKSSVDVTISEDERAQLHRLVEPEYQLLNQVRFTAHRPTRS